MKEIGYSLLILSLIAVTSCAPKPKKGIDFYVKHNPVQNPNGIYFEDDPDFVKSYEAYIKKSNKNNKARTLIDSPTSINNIDDIDNIGNAKEVNTSGSGWNNDIIPNNLNHSLKKESEKSEKSEKSKKDEKDSKYRDYLDRKNLPENATIQNDKIILNKGGKNPEIIYFKVKEGKKLDQSPKMDTKKVYTLHDEYTKRTKQGKKKHAFIRSNAKKKTNIKPITKEEKIDNIVNKVGIEVKDIEEELHRVSQLNEQKTPSNKLARINEAHKARLQQSLIENTSDEPEKKVKLKQHNKNSVEKKIRTPRLKPQSYSKEN